MKKLLFVAPLLFLAPLLSVAQQTEKVDLNTIHRIKEEALGRNSKVMDHAFYLTDVNGPRLQSSKGYRAAADGLQLGEHRIDIEILALLLARLEFRLLAGGLGGR